jgi:hypothetical protein
MADDRRNRGPQDRARINTGEDYEIEYWTKKWGVSKEELQNAVAEVGASVRAVAKHLGKEV